MTSMPVWRRRVLVSTALDQRVGEGIVLLPRTLHPQDVVEEQRLAVQRGESAQFEVGPVQDDAAQRPDLGIDAKLRRRGGRLALGDHGGQPSIGVGAACSSEDRTEARVVTGLDARWAPLRGPARRLRKAQLSRSDASCSVKRAIASL
jgi:hypothetical protein